MRGIIVLLCCVVSPLFAQTAPTVRSGNHDGFTRLVVVLPKDQEWAITQEQRKYVISAEGWESGFNVSGVFNRIGRDRIADISASTSGFEVSLACDCNVRTLPLTGGGLIMDIRDGPPAQALQPEIGAALIETTAPSALAIPHSRDDTESDVLRDRFRDQLIRQLTMAARTSQIELAVEEAEVSPLAPTMRPSQVLDLQRLRIRDPNTESRPEPDTVVADSSKTCPDPEDFDIAAWSTDAPFFDQLASIRSGLSGEFDEIDQEEVEKLVRLYLHYGLVAEARTTMRALALEPEAAEALELIAHIMEPNVSGGSNALQKCEGELAIWALLSNHRTYLLSKERVSNISAKFAEWPKHMRMSLGPQLVEILEIRGWQTGASVLQTQIDPQLRLPSVDAATDVARNPEELLDQINAGGEDAPRAMASYLTQLAEQNMPVSEAMLELASAFELEYRGLPVSDALNLARIKALTANGTFTAARRLLTDRLDRQGEVPDDLVELLASLALQQKDMAGRSALIVLFKDRNLLVALTRETTDEAMETLLLSGLPELADLLAGVAETALDDPLFNARIQASQFRLSEAVDVLEQHDTQSADALRAELLIRLGRAEDARQDEIAKLGDDLQEDLAWAAGRWSDMTGEGPRNDLARLLSEAPPDPLVSETPIADARAMAGTSETARTLIETLLAVPLED